MPPSCVRVVATHIWDLSLQLTEAVVFKPRYRTVDVRLRIQGQSVMLGVSRSKTTERCTMRTGVPLQSAARDGHSCWTNTERRRPSREHEVPIYERRILYDVVQPSNLGVFTALQPTSNQRFNGSSTQSGHQERQ